MSIVRSPLVPLRGVAATVPVSSTRRPSVASPGPRRGAGRARAGCRPVTVNPLAWVEARAGHRGRRRRLDDDGCAPRRRRGSVRHADDDAARRVGDRDERRHPSRPASAVTTPATVTTVPTGAPRASTIVSVPGGVGPGAKWVPGWRSASAWAWVRVRAPRSAPRSRRGRGGRSGGYWRGGVGVGRRHEDEIALLGGVDPIAGEARAAAVALPDRADGDHHRPARDAPTPQRLRADDDPDRARAVVDHQTEPVRQVRWRPTVMPWTTTRQPSTASPISPVCIADPAGSRPEPRTRMSTTLTRSVRSANRSSTVPATLTSVPAGIAGGDGDVEVQRDPGRLVLDECLAARLERTEGRRQDAGDSRGRAVRQGPGLDDRDGWRWGRSRLCGRREGRSGGRCRRDPGVGAAVGVGDGAWAPASASARRRERGCRLGGRHRRR